ncbi:MAG: RNA polymerase sigma factor RpoE [Pseudomonadales bacterium]|nr:RNA polymerase sigma factor RpoE [Pseudomonadales bacterium]
MSEAQKASGNDQALVALVQKGDKRAYDLLVIKYQHKVLSIISRFISDPHEAQDVAQEAFIKAYRALSSFRGDSQFYTWLYRIAVNSAKNHLATRKRRPSNDVSLDDSEYTDGISDLQDIETPENRLARDELKALLMKTIEQLSDELKSAITLREFEGLSYEEIADIMGCPVGTVRSRIFRAREAIDEKIHTFMEGRETNAGLGGRKA